jgi:hypothetical protein
MVHRTGYNPTESLPSSDRTSLIIAAMRIYPLGLEFFGILISTYKTGNRCCEPLLTLILCKVQTVLMYVDLLYMCM